MWHTVKSLEGGAAILGIKDREYRPLEEDEIWKGYKRNLKGFGSS